MSRPQSERPDLHALKNSSELVRWYWLRSELLEFARQHGIPSACRKPQLIERIEHFLDTGKVEHPENPVPNSRFDWGKQPLTLDTLITDSYRNSQNVRRFMKAQASESFKFSNEFMDWMRGNTGKRLEDAVAFWLELDRKKREEGYREEPLPQNQYNGFSRALSEAVPGISSAELRRIWAVKRSMPGPHEYKRGDEHL